MTETIQGGVRSCRSVDELLVGVIVDLLRRGSSVAPRGQETLELQGYAFRLTNPRARRVGVRARRWSEAIAVGELCWHMSGSDSAAFISYYARRWQSFSDDGTRIAGSCYGRKIFGETRDVGSQWTRVRRELQRDPASRRAIIGLLDTSFADDAKDVACMNTIQFLIRDGRLNCVVYMRSNDVIWGLCYDVFVVTMLQERLACELHLPQGWYQQVCGSIHLYHDHMAMAEAIRQEEVQQDPVSMPEMDHVEAIPAFLEAERALRLGHTDPLALVDRLPLYWKGLAGSLVAHSRIRSAATRDVPAGLEREPVDPAG